MTKKTLIIHPFMFAVFPILFLYSHNIEQLSFNVTFFPIAVSISCTILTMSLSTFLFRDIHKAGILTSVFIFIFFTYGHFCALLKKHIEFSTNTHDQLIVLVLVTFVVVLILLIKVHISAKVTKVLNIVGACTLILATINIAIYKYKLQNQNIDQSSYTLGRMDNQTGRATKDLRDIYYIVLDGYAHSATLKDQFGFDNNEFLGYLAGKHFYIANKSCANYPCTYLSLASSLNMQYLDHLKYKNEDSPKDTGILSKMIAQNKITKFLKSKGYLYIHFSSYWPSTRDNELADIKIGFNNKYPVIVDISEFEDILIKTTLLSAFRTVSVSIIKNRAGQLLTSFSALSQLYKIKKPKFVFAHIMLPHPPYIFDRNGQPVLETESTGSNWQPKNQYLDQLIYTNKLVEDCLDTIIKKSDNTPIVILQSDHGSAFFGNAHTKKVLQERMRILNCYLLPGVDKSELYNSITPVNSFRLVLKHYFGSNNDLLDDHAFFTETDESFYNFVDISDKISFD